MTLVPVKMRRAHRCKPRRLPVLLVFVVALSLFGRFPAPAQAASPTIPDTPIGAVLSEMLDVIRSGDIEKARDFVTRRYAAEALAARPMESRLDGWRDLMGSLAQPKLLEVRTGSGNPAMIIESGATGEVFEVVVRPAPGVPDKITGVRMQSTIPGKPAIPAGPITDKERSALIDQLLDRLVADDRFSGVVMLAKDGKPAYQRATGMANQSWSIPNRIDTKFCLGSMNKMFTSLAVARLVQDGKLAYGDKVGKYLPDFPNAAVREKVTIHHLLTHTSGLGSYFDDPEYALDWTRMRHVSDYTTCVASESLAFEPGAEMRYSNSGFIVLGLIIEQVSGRDYYDFVRDTVLRPAGMNDSDSFENDQVVPNLAIGYTMAGTRMRHGGAGASAPAGASQGGSGSPGAAGGAAQTRKANFYEHSARGTPAGGGYSTAPDLLKFSQALSRGSIVTAALVDTVTTAKVAMGPGAGYGYGFGDFRGTGDGYFGHNGGAPGMSTDFRIYDKLGYTVIVLSNYDGIAGSVADFIDQLIVPPPTGGPGPGPGGPGPGGTPGRP
ncbi:MAG TPA: serine hydrolase domain-containing protein [Candidatus Eisenbacteria bacterium]